MHTSASNMPGRRTEPSGHFDKTAFPVAKADLLRLARGNGVDLRRVSLMPHRLYRQPGEADRAIESVAATDLEAAIPSLGPWFHNLHLQDGTQTAPDHFLGDFPTFKWQPLAGSCRAGPIWPLSSTASTATPPTGGSSTTPGPGPCSGPAACA